MLRKNIKLTMQKERGKKNSYYTVILKIRDNTFPKNYVLIKLKQQFNCNTIKIMKQRYTMREKQLLC